MKFSGVCVGLAAFFLAFMMPAEVASVPYTWRSVKVGGGGFIPGIVFSRVQRGLVYLRSDMGGAYRWDAGQKSWRPLQDNMGESSYFGVESIAPDPVDAQTVYLAAGMYRSEKAAILRSRDLGKTFEIFPVSFKMGGNEAGRGLGERLAIDPHATRILYFGSRYDGLMRSTDAGATWEKVAGFPRQGGGEAGLSFVVFDGNAGTPGAATKTIFVGSADPGSPHLFRSDDAGATWQAIVGEPKAELLPVKAELESTGMLYISYSNGVGPNGVTDGAVYRLNTNTGEWRDISPDQRPEKPPGGYMGISLDRQHPGTLAVATMNRWNPGDTVWRSSDGGATWADIVGKSQREISETPFLTFGRKAPRLGWWMAALAIDPFDSDFAAYGTGATIYATTEFSKVSQGLETTWKPWVEGIEQTAVITLMSPSAGPPLLSGFGDIGGFVHLDLAKSPAGMFANPVFTHADTLAFAGEMPNVVVRSGRPPEGEAGVAYSDDYGTTWQPLPLPAGAEGEKNHPPVVTSADGKVFMVMTEIPQVSTDRGVTWKKVEGLPGGVRPIADRVNGRRFYGLDYSSGRLFASVDGGQTFGAAATTGLPADISKDEARGVEAASTFHATPGHEGDLWVVSRQGLFHSSDSGATFSKTSGPLQVRLLSLGKPAAGSGFPTLFAVGKEGSVEGIWRSVDQGESWVRVNDDEHRYGNRFRCIAADLRVFGRVYVGTDGRGILYGEPAAAE